MVRHSKTVLFSFLVMIMVLFANRQAQAQTYLNNPFPRTITVEGSAEMEVMPDEVYVNFRIEEYNKKGEGKQDIEVLKKQFLSSCMSVGIADSDINIYSYGGNAADFPRKRRNPDMLTSITFQIRFQTAKKLDQLTAIIDDEAISSFSIAGAEHSRASQFRKELKIKALPAAKEKAGYLAASIGEQPGVAITIEELDRYAYGSNLSNMVSQATNTRNDSPGLSYEKDSIAFRKIKYRYVMKAVFALK